jgi:hypothetical protein
MSVYQHVVEIGAGDSYSSEALNGLAMHARRMTLFEPNRLLWADLMRGAAGLDNVTVRPEAVGDRGMWPLIHLGYASYLREMPSFYATSIEPEGHRYVEALARGVPLVSTDEAVPSDVDYLILTINGGESRLLGTMTARPAIIRTKHRCHHARHWDDAHRTFAWMAVNRYVGRQVDTVPLGTYHHIEWSLSP